MGKPLKAGLNIRVKWRIFGLLKKGREERGGLLSTFSGWLVALANQSIIRALYCTVPYILK